MRLPWKRHHRRPVSEPSSAWDPSDPWDPRNPENRDRTRRLRADLRQRLLDDWDPIGVSGVPEADDEYDGYLTPLMRLLHSGAREKEVRDYLVGVLDGMGLRPHGDREDRVARDLLTWWRDQTA